MTQRGLVWVFVLLTLASSAPTHATQSTCFGTPDNGRLEGGVRITASSGNVSAYSRLGVALGRTYVHSTVARIVHAAYAEVASTMPDTVFVYGESGWVEGGRMEPHRTHQNGLAVDFMVPVLDARNRSVPLPTGIANRFGYDIEFDASAHDGDLHIDFEAMAEHLYALHRTAKQQGVDIARVIFEPAFLPQLFAARRGRYVQRNIAFLPRQAWVRHDEHYHVDFSVPCKAL